MAGISRAYKRRNNMVANTGAPVMCLDAGSRISYPGSGTTWTDLSGNGNTGTLINGPTYNSANGGAIVFDGVNDYVDVPAFSALSFGTGDFSISIWAKFSVLNSYQDLFGTGNNNVYMGTAKSGWILAYHGTNSINFSYQSSNSWIFDRIFGCTNAINTWYKTDVTRESGIMKLYRNGALLYSVTQATNIVSTESFVRIGGGYSSGSGLVNGSISSAVVYSRALSAAEISQNFNLLRGRYGI